MQRAQRVKAWVAARSLYALISVGIGMMSVVDSLLAVLSIPTGATAIVLGAMGLRDLRRRPQMNGHRLCMLGMTLGVAGLALTLFVWPHVFER